MVIIMSNEARTILDKIQTQWTQWVQNKVEFKIIDQNDIQVLTAFTDYFGDGILFSIIKNDDGSYKLTDKGYTCWNLEMNGIDVSNNNTTRNRLFNWYLTSFDFELHNNAIQKDKIKFESLSQGILDFIQLLLRVYDLGSTSRANTRGIFFDDAKNYFNNDENSFYFTTNNIALGRTKQQYVFEYNFTPKLGINKLTKLYNTLSKNTMEAIIGIHSDTIDFLKDNYREVSFNVLVNGISSRSQIYVDGLKQHNIRVIDFQDKDLVKNTFGKIV